MLSLSNLITKFPAYLRGIETQLRPRHIELPHRFQPTYEGLKLTTGLSLVRVPSRFPAYLRGIETKEGTPHV